MANIEPFNVVDFDELDEDAPKGPGINDTHSGEGSATLVNNPPAVSDKGKGPVNIEESPRPLGFSPITPKEQASAVGDGTPTPQNRLVSVSDHFPSPTNKLSATPKGQKLPNNVPPSSFSASKPSVDDTTEVLHTRVADTREQFYLDTRIMEAGYKGPCMNEVRFTVNEKASVSLANVKKPQPPAVAPKLRSTISDLPTFQKQTYQPPNSEMKRRVGEDLHDWLNKAWGDMKQLGTLPLTHCLWDVRLFNYPPVEDLDSFFGWFYTMVVTDALREEAQHVVDNASWAVVCVDGVCTADTASATLEQHMADVWQLQAYPMPCSRMTSKQLNAKYVTMFLKAAGPDACQMLNVVVKLGQKLHIQELWERVSDLQAYATSRFPPLPAGCCWVRVARTNLPQKRPAPEFTEMELADGMKRSAPAPPTEQEAKQAGGVVVVAMEATGEAVDEVEVVP
ncbi:hypothetical protein HDU93_005323 [Gonapodya sp. JEL0774]|nr:hypothetical protein HDU93_005323 [Gonapodya sp. JEL0774]